MTLPLDPAAQDLLFREAHTAQKFASEPVTEAQIQEIYELIKYAPTAFNQSPLRITLVRSAEARERLVSHMSPGNQEKTRTAPLTAILAVDLAFHERLPELAPAKPELKDTLFADSGYRETSGKLNATLQIGYFLIGVRAAGLAAGPMTGFDASAVDKEFFPDGEQHTLVIANIGMPVEGGHFPRAPRLRFEDAVTVV